MKAVICPVCNGSGVYYGESDGDQTSIVHRKYTCHGCGGKGWVEVSEEQPSYPWK